MTTAYGIAVIANVVAVMLAARTYRQLVFGVMCVAAGWGIVSVLFFRLT
jgi:hypothetical protein